MVGALRRQLRFRLRVEAVERWRLLVLLVASQLPCRTFCLCRQLRGMMLIQKFDFRVVGVTNLVKQPHTQRELSYYTYNFTVKHNYYLILYRMCPLPKEVRTPVGQRCDTGHLKRPPQYPPSSL
jgi:hypothetical protein